MVSLPKDWADTVGIKQGDTVLIEKEEDGSLKIFPSLEPTQNEPLQSIVDADMCQEKQLLTRILTGNYVLGRDTIKVISKTELSSKHLGEIRATTRRLTGIGIVEQTIREVTIQSFVDPTKFPVNGLIRRLFTLTWSMLGASMSSLLENRPELINEALRMESEVDRIYWLITRQLLLSAQDTGLMKTVGINSTRGIIGYRLIAKHVEEIADYTENIAKEVQIIQTQNYSVQSTVLKELADFNQLIHMILSSTMKALFTDDLFLANNVIEMVNQADRKAARARKSILINEKEVSLAIALKSITWSLRQIARMCDVIAEISINGILGRSSEINKIEKIS